jgi:tellurite resistance protein TerC
MGASGPVWTATAAAIAMLVLFDYFFHVRRTPAPTVRDAAAWSVSYVGIAILFGVGVWIFGGTAMGLEYFACYVSNAALSVDNLFVFLFIISSFAVPRIAQQKVLLLGILLALVARTGLIFVSAALIAVFDWAFYLFGLVLLIMAGNLATPPGRSIFEAPAAKTTTVRIARRFPHTSETYDGDRLFTVNDSRRTMTPMLFVMVAIGGTDVLFSFDSIPALFGLSQNVFVVFSATAFVAIGPAPAVLLDRRSTGPMVYMSYGLAAILAFIGANLMLLALHHNNIPLINSGKPVPITEVSTTLSLTAIVIILLITTAGSLSQRSQ